MSNARFQSNGVDLLIDSLQAAGEKPGDVRDRLWQTVWARSYQDVLVPLPMPDTKVEGFVVLERAFSPRHTLVCIDDGEHLVGLIDEFPAVSLGSKVRIQPLYGNNVQWSMKVLATIGCGLQIRFDDNERSETAWLDRLRTCLLQIRETELAVRRQIEHDRRRIQFVVAPLPFRTEMEAADKELRERVLAGGYTEDEKRLLAKAKSPDAMQKVVAIRNKRLVEAYRAEVVTFRQQIPALRRAWDKKMEAYAEFRKHVDRCNEVDASSRSITDATLKASEMLSVIELAVLNVKAVDLDRIEDDPKANLHEIVSTIELLYELVPKRLQRSAASAAS
jgi:hypothetical protein